MTVAYGGGPAVYVYDTNVPGIGIALAANGYLSNYGWAGWQASASYHNASNIARAGVGLVTGSFTVGAQVAVALVKTSAQITAGGTVTGGQVIYAYPATSYNAAYEFPNLAVKYVTTPVQIIPLTCTTPDVNVPMGTFKTTDFPSVGSLSPNPANFTVQFLNCPAGTAVSGTQAGVIHTIQYRIDPTNGTLATNVAALSGSPSATGVGIQLFNSAGAVFPLSTFATLSGYNSTSGGDYSIPMTARYYRTGTITAGAANTTMTLTVSYQ